MAKVTIPHPRWQGDFISAEAEQKVVFTPGKRGIETVVKLDKVMVGQAAYPDRTWTPGPKAFEEWLVKLSLKVGQRNNFMVFLHPVEKIREVPHGSCSWCGQETSELCFRGTHFLCGYDNARPGVNLDCKGGHVRRNVV